MLLASCQDSSALAPDAAQEGQGSPPRSDVVVNEVEFAGSSGSDWIELANRTPSAIDLDGFFLTDDGDRLDHYYVFPTGTRLAPMGYIVVQADDGASGEGHHAPFKLARADGALLLDKDGLVLDSVLFLGPEDGRSLARLPDLEGLFFATTPSPGARNGKTL